MSTLHTLTLQGQGHLRSRVSACGSQSSQGARGNAIGVSILVGGLEHFIFSHIFPSIGNVIIPIDELIFSEELVNHQPDMVKIEDPLEAPGFSIAFGTFTVQHYRSDDQHTLKTDANVCTIKRSP